MAVADDRKTGVRIEPVDLDEVAARLSPGQRRAFDDAGAVIEAASFVRGLRARHGLDQTELAAAAGLSQDQISNIERAVGRKGPTIATLARIAAAVGERLGLRALPAQAPSKTVPAVEIDRPDWSWIEFPVIELGHRPFADRPAPGYRPHAHDLWADVELASRPEGSELLVHLGAAEIEDVAIGVQDRILTITAEGPSARGDMARVERGFLLAPDIDTDAITATSAEGVLVVSLPRRVLALEPLKIEIEAPGTSPGLAVR